MAFKLLIRLKNTAENNLSSEWLLLDENGHVKSADKDSLSGFVKDATTVVLVPGEDVLLTQVKLPKLSPARLIKAIPYALEDQLIEDPAVLHFAIGPAQNALVPIAVVSKEKMDKWRAYLRTTFKEYYLSFKAFVPDVLAISWQPGSYQVLIDNQLAYVRTGKNAGFVIDNDELFKVLQLMLKRPHAEKPEAIKIYGKKTSVMTDLQAAELGIRLEEMPAPQNNLAVMTAFFQEAPPPINLLQYDYAPRQKKLSMDQLIWAGFAIIGVWLILITVTNIMSYFILWREKNAIDHEIQQIYADVYPNAAIPEDPKTSMQKNLSALRANQTGSAFIHLLNMVGPSLAQITGSGATLKEMSYKNNQLNLDMESNNLPIIDELRKSLENQGLKVKLSNAERGANGSTEVRLTVEEMS